MSSPRLNNVIVVGCMMTYFSVILFGLDGDLVSAEQYFKVCIVRSFICIYVNRIFLTYFLYKTIHHGAFFFFQIW